MGAVVKEKKLAIDSRMCGIINSIIVKRNILIIVCLLFVIDMNAQVRPLSITSDGYSFKTSDGKPFFWLGDTGWLLFVKLKREAALQYLDTRKAQGFNVVQVMVLHDMQHAVNAYGDSALIGNDASTPALTPGNDPTKSEEYDFWDHIDFIIDEAARRGIYMALVPVWGTNVKNGWMNERQAEIYATFLANRYKNKINIIWLNGGDIKGTDSIAVWNKIGKTLRKLDPLHLITFHPRGRFTSSRWFHREQWLDFNMFQSGHRNYLQDTSKGETNYGEDNWKYVQEDRGKLPIKPTLDGEPSYEGIPHGLHDTTQLYWNDSDLRRYAYWSVFAGAAGFTYGHNAVMQFYQPGDSSSAYGAKQYWQQAMNDKGATQMIHLQNLVNSVFWSARFPDQKLTTNSGKKYDRLAAIQSKGYAFIYTYNGRNIIVDMKRIWGTKIIASWYDPRTGKYTAVGNYVNKGREQFDPPGDPAPGNDWVLVLKGSK
jgi:hypothetical protein